MHSRRLYHYIPLYARLLDELGIIEHLCDAGIQPQLAHVYQIVASLENFYDPSHPFSISHLDWLGQFVGLGAQGEHFLGIGINPNWERDRKVKLILGAAAYWGIKGTEKGVREAIDLWLSYSNAKERNYFYIVRPWGEQPNTFPLWWQFGDAYGIESLQPFVERKTWGSGDYLPGQSYLPDLKVLLGSRETAIVPIEGSRSHLGALNLWEHFDFDLIPEKRTCVVSNAIAVFSIDVGEETTPVLGRTTFSYSDEEFCLFVAGNDIGSQWNRITPDIIKLNYEMLPAMADPVVFSWINIKERINISKVANPPPNAKKVDIYPRLRFINEASNWILNIRVRSDRTVQYHNYPVTMIWQDTREDETRRGLFFHPTQLDTLRLEFVFYPQDDGTIERLELLLVENEEEPTLIVETDFRTPLNLSSRVAVGARILLDSLIVEDSNGGGGGGGNGGNGNNGDGGDGGGDGDTGTTITGSYILYTLLKFKENRVMPTGGIWTWYDLEYYLKFPSGRKELLITTPFSFSNDYTELFQTFGSLNYGVLSFDSNGDWMVTISSYWSEYITYNGYSTPSNDVVYEQNHYHTIYLINKNGQQNLTFNTLETHKVIKTFELVPQTGNNYANTQNITSISNGEFHVLAPLKQDYFINFNFLDYSNRNIILDLVVERDFGVVLYPRREYVLNLPR